jgi:hypothetical protein
LSRLLDHPEAESRDSLTPERLEQKLCWLRSFAAELAEWRESLKKRTLTNLYNERPAWLDLAHKRLDEAVRAAYGWDAGIADEELLEKLLELNLARAGGGG